MYNSQFCDKFGPWPQGVMHLDTKRLQQEIFRKWEIFFFVEDTSEYYIFSSEYVSQRLSHGD